MSYGDLATPPEPSAVTPVAAGAKGTPAGPAMPKKPWQLLMPGEPFDPATAPKDATVRDQVRDWVTEQPSVSSQLCRTRLCCQLLRYFAVLLQRLEH